MDKTTTFDDGSTITAYDGGGYAISGHDAMTAYNLLWLKSYLPFEMKTGIVMSRRQSALDVARAISGIKFRNRKQALAWLGTVIEL